MRPAAEDFDIIRARVAEIRDAEKPKCPRAPSKLLYDCLRETARCPSECPYYNDWIGPTTAAEK